MYAMRSVCRGVLRAAPHAQVRGMSDKFQKFDSNKNQEEFETRRVPPILGVVEDFAVYDRECTTRNGKTFWKHYYTVNGMTAMKCVYRQWLREQPEQGCEEGRYVAMRCVIDARDHLYIQSIRPASRKEETIIRDRRKEEMAKQNDNLSGMMTREKVVLSILKSPVAANLDPEAFEKLVLSTYTFVKA